MGVPKLIYIAVSDLEAVFSRAKLLPFQEIDEEINSRPWGERSFYGKVPFGNPICIVDEKTIFTG